MNDTTPFDYIVVGSGAGGGTLGGAAGRGRAAGVAARSRRRPAPLVGHQRRPARHQPPARRLRRAVVPRLRLRERRDALGFLCPPLCRRGDAGEGPEIRPRLSRPAGRRRPLSARRHLGRLHRAQRDDPRLSAQRRLGRDRPADRRPVMERRGDAPVFHAPRKLPSPPAGARAGQARPQPVASRLGRLAPHRKGGAGGRPRRFRAGPGAAQLGRRRVRGYRPADRAADRARRVEGRSERLASGRRQRRRRALYAADDARSPAHGHARAGAGDRAEISRPAAHRARRAGHPDHPRRRQPRDRGRIFEGAAALPRSWPTRHRAGRADAAPRLRAR